MPKNKKLIEEIQEIKNKLRALEKIGEREPQAEYYYCWDFTKYGIDNYDCQGVKKVKAGYLINYPEKLKNFLFIPIL